MARRTQSGPSRAAAHGSNAELRGVSFRADRACFQAQVNVSGYQRKLSLGEFKDPRLAAAAFNLGVALVTAETGFSVRLRPNDDVDVSPLPVRPCAHANVCVCICNPRHKLGNACVCLGVSVFAFD